MICEITTELSIDLSPRFFDFRNSLHRMTVFGCAVNTVGYFGDSFFCVILIRKCSSVRENGLADDLVC